MMLSTVNRDTSCVPELRFHNYFRLSVQTSPTQPWSQSDTVFFLELNLPEPHISFPLSKFFVDAAIELWPLAHPLCGQFPPDIAEDLSSRYRALLSKLPLAEESRLRYQCEIK